ncbi:flippase activity-associated protein Agl23 [Halococcus salsus]|uniref:flippase activity-associated protein Agl23 n=1 Tax=Halococcus salsus TaxID=2162894 RepID=UPI0013580610|nr:flippase activity-associated protein Agl23 [Halococcus salsus]
MASTDGTASRQRAGRGRRVVFAVVAIALLGLLARLAFLGDRTAHWDEARVAYWTLHYLDTGLFEYQPIIHGPFLQQVNRAVFAVLGPNDFTMRLVVALLGAGLPLVALCFRERLSGVETVALAGFLAFDPLVLYYSRFMRSDLPLAAFALLALGCFVRALDTRKPRSLHAGVLAFALAVTTKEYVLVYVVTWLGALVLLADHRLFGCGLPTDWRGRLRVRIRSARPALRRWLPHLLASFVAFLVVVVYFYAPRTGPNGGPGFDDLFADPTVLPAVVGEATIGSWQAFVSLWVGGGHQDHAYLPFLGSAAETLFVGSGALAVLSVVGFLVDRYADDGPRDLVAFCFYWGFVSVLGYPIIADIAAPWTVLHAVVPLAVPAAVGVGALYRRGYTALASENRPAVAAVAVMGLLVVGQVGFVATTDVYLDDQSDANPLVQYAQPASDLHPALHEMESVSAANSGTDLLLYGDFLVANTTGTREPGCSEWFDVLPLPWYFEAEDVRVACARNDSAFESAMNRSHPPVVVSLSSDADSLEPRLAGYEAYPEVIRTQDTSRTNITVFVEGAAANASDTP